MIAFGASLSHKTFLITASKCELMPGYVPRMSMEMSESMPAPKWSSLLDLLSLQLLLTLLLPLIINGAIFGTPFWRFRKFLLLHTWGICVLVLPFPLLLLLLPPETQLVDTAITLSLLQAGQRLAEAASLSASPSIGSPAVAPSSSFHSFSLCHCLFHCWVHMCAP